ncbi:hypothetical protein JCM10908_001556 [Rhodotorula pacifica]|uniref:uncharacterized protein n=1 Tax=Rhodotorula pacifica TaxID=1495444 RepID=UPI00316F151A
MAPTGCYFDSDDDEWVCDVCGCTFDERSDALEHLESANDHWYCRPCDRLHKSQESRRRHWATSRKHAGRFCNYCDSLIAAGDTMNEHDEALHWPCRGCDRVFRTSEARASHGKASHPWCTVHKRAFLSQANYEAHMRSAAHVGRTQPCPYRCRNTFTNRSAVVLHLEVGACASGVTRAKVDEFLRSHDHTFAGVNGPGDGEKPYKCSNTECSKKFSTLSGVMQHVESGSCGVLQTRGTDSALDSLLDDLRRLTL